LASGGTTKFWVTQACWAIAAGISAGISPGAASHTPAATANILCMFCSRERRVSSARLHETVSGRRPTVNQRLTFRLPAHKSGKRMPIQYTIDHKARYVEAKFHGTLTLKDVEDFTDAVVGADALPYKKLIDGRTATGTYTDADVMAMGARLSAYATMGKRGALAVVPASQKYAELAERLLNLGKDGRPAKAFVSIDDARKWLAAQPEA
jgi:hypothetical protein